MTNLRNTRGSIIKVSSRDRTGRTIHKNQFSSDDPKSVREELKTWKDKLGVPNKVFKEVMESNFDNEEYNNVRELMRTLLSKDLCN